MVDEFRSALEVATEEELQQLTNILFCRRLNPIDYLQTPAPIDVQSQDLPSWLDTIEQRFRFLAADGMTVLKRRTHQVSYREILVKFAVTSKFPTIYLWQPLTLKRRFFCIYYKRRGQSYLLMSRILSVIR